MIENVRGLPSTGSDSSHYPSERVSVFNNVRDIPYVIGQECAAFDGLLFSRKHRNWNLGTRKNFVLAAAFKKLGLDVSYATFAMNWKDQRLHFPRHILEIAFGIPNVYHLALVVRINRSPIFVDATFDLPLENIGAQVTKNWDGKTDTLIASDFFDIEIHKSLESCVERYRIKSASLTDEDRLRLKVFSTLMNKWFNQVREIHDYKWEPLFNPERCDTNLLNSTDKHGFLFG